MTKAQQGSRAYLFSIVLVAVLGGLLFGYDTAVISGAEKGLQAFFDFRQSGCFRTCVSRYQISTEPMSSPFTQWSLFWSIRT